MGSRKINYIGKTFGDFEIFFKLKSRMEESGNDRTEWAGCCQRCFLMKGFNQRSLKRNKSFNCECRKHEKIIS